MRVRASVGRPGASAHAQYRRRRAAELAAWTHSLPWRIAAVLAVGPRRLAARPPDRSPLAAPAGASVAAGLGWRLRFRAPPDTMAWRRGAAGERRTARLLAPLERHGWAVLHDLAIPGTQANIDHLVIGPGGVLVIDSKQYRGQLRLDADGLLWHGRHLLVATLRKLRWAADQADEVLGVADVQVVAIMAVHGAKVPWGQLTADGVIVVSRPADAGPAAGPAGDPWPRAGGLAGRPSSAAVPRRRLTATPVSARNAAAFTASPGRLLDALDAFDQRRPAHCCPRTIYGSSVERAAKLHAL